jgi:hypothetical protein
MLATTQVAFAAVRPVAAGGTGISPTPLVIVLPFLLWAALRFGTSGASLALLATALSAVEGAIAGGHVTDVVAAEQAVLGVQVFLIMLAVPLLGFAALIEERYHARLDLSERLRFEAMLARVSSTFVGVPGNRMPEALLSAVERLGRFVGAEAAVLFEPMRASPDARSAHATSPLVLSWATSDALRSELAGIFTALPWVVDQVAHEHLVVWTPVPAADAAEADRTFLARHRIENLVALPVYQGPRVVGGLVLSGRSRAPWSSDAIARVRQASAVLGQALGHWRTDQALRESESVRSAILGAIPMGVAVRRGGCRSDVDDPRDGRSRQVPRWMPRGRCAGTAGGRRRPRRGRKRARPVARAVRRRLLRRARHGRSVVHLARGAATGRRRRSARDARGDDGAAAGGVVRAAEPQRAGARRANVGHGRTGDLARAAAERSPVEDRRGSRRGPHAARANGARPAGA